jgi:hypothetical protein
MLENAQEEPVILFWGGMVMREAKKYCRLKKQAGEKSSLQ